MHSFNNTLGVCIALLGIGSAEANQGGDIPVPYSETSPCAIVTEYPLLNGNPRDPLIIEASAGFEFEGPREGALERCLYIARTGVAAQMPSQGMQLGPWSRSRMRFRQQGHVIQLEMKPQSAPDPSRVTSCSLQSTYRLVGGRSLFRAATVSLAPGQDQLAACLNLSVRGALDLYGVQPPGSSVLVETLLRVESPDVTGTGNVRSVRAAVRP